MFGQHRMSPQERVDAEKTVAFYRARGGSKFTALVTTLTRMRDGVAESQAYLAEPRCGVERRWDNAVAVAMESFGMTPAIVEREAARRGLDRKWFWEQGLSDIVARQNGRVA